MPECSNLWLFGLLFLAFSLPSGYAQSRKELEDKRKYLQQEIRQTTNQLKSTQKQEKATLRVYLTLQQQIRSRQELVQNLHTEIAVVDQRINRALEVIEAMEGDVQRLQAEYSNMLRIALRQKITQSAVLFLFSAQDLNDAFKRWQYLRQFERYRSKQARLIRETQRTLEDKTKQLAGRRTEKERMLGTLEVEQIQLKSELVKKDVLLKSLKTDEKKLASELNHQQETQRKLNQAIETVIQQEIIALRKKARQTENNPERKPENRESVNAPFRQKKGSLPWPLPGGTIIRGFGTQQHPRFKDVKTQSNGIDIRAEGTFSVQAIFAGRVAGIMSIPGHQNTLILQHGAYYTVYSNLAEVFVKRNSQVSANQEIGRLSKAEPALHFEIWQEQSKLDPEPWISRTN